MRKCRIYKDVEFEANELSEEELSQVHDLLFAAAKKIMSLINNEYEAMSFLMMAGLFSVDSLEKAYEILSKHYDISFDSESMKNHIYSFNPDITNLQDIHVYAVSLGDDLKRHLDTASSVLGIKSLLYFH